MPTFDAMAEAYEAWYGTPLGRLTDELERAAVFALVPGRPGSAADLSCGTGHYALLPRVGELRRGRGEALAVDDRSLGVLFGRRSFWLRVCAPAAVPRPGSVPVGRV